MSVSQLQMYNIILLKRNSLDAWIVEVEVAIIVLHESDIHLPPTG